MLKADGLGELLEVDAQKVYAFWREAHVQVKPYKTHHVQSAFGSDLEKSVWRTRAKHMSKSKRAKHTTFGALLEAEMFKSSHRLDAKHMSKSKALKAGGLAKL